MGFALLKRDTGDDGSDGASFKARLHAWWHGYDLDPNAPPRGSKSSGDGSAMSKSDAMPDEGRPDRATESSDSDPSEGGDANTWSDTRRQLAQEIWTPGFVVPGGLEYVEKLVSGCSLTEAETMLEVGVGMGGGTRAIIGKFGNYVTGYEENPDLAAAAVRHAVTYEIDDKVDITTTPFDDLRVKAGYFRAALIRDVLYTVEGKTQLLEQVANSLKSGDSYLVMTDLLFDADDTSPELEAWKAVEGRPVYPWTEAELTKSLQKLGVTPRIIADDSEEYRTMVVKAWGDYVKTIEGTDVSEELGTEMAREGEYWTRRSAALEAGCLKYYRVEAVRMT